MRLRLRIIIAELRRLRDDNQGVTALEYGLIAAVTVTSIATTVSGLSAPIAGAFCRVFQSFGGAC